MIKLDVQIALSKLNEYIHTVDNLINKNYKEGGKLREKLNLDIESLLRNTFEDAERRIKKFDNYVNWIVLVAGVKKSDKEEQEDYERRLEDTKMFLESWKNELEFTSQVPTPTDKAKNHRTVFIIHGHDETNLLRLEKLLKEFNLTTITLKDEAQGGQTLIEKFEKYASSSSYAFALMTPDDMVNSKDQKYNQPRPNVIFELGWFYGRLGRKNVCILFKKGSKIHSDLDGIGRINFENNIIEKSNEIKRELQSVGLI